VRRKFSPEFVNRLDKLVVFRPLRAPELDRILDIELGMVQQRLRDRVRGQCHLQVTPAARAYLLDEGTNIDCGARHLKRTIERNIVSPLANLLATQQIELGDLLLVDWDAAARRLVFEREGQVDVSQAKVASAAAAGR
jgi:ATP-dependent Clp protease ATP-binding subunit ClpA